LWFRYNSIKSNSCKIINNIVTTFNFNFKNDFHVRKKKKIVGKYVLKCYYVPKCIYIQVYLPISTWNWIFIDWTENDDSVSGSATTGIMHLDIIMALLVRLRWSRNILSHPQPGRYLRPIFTKTISRHAFRRFGIPYLDAQHCSVYILYRVYSDSI